jgi:hypothetical protein
MGILAGADPFGHIRSNGDVYRLGYRWISIDNQLIRMEHPIQIRIIAAAKCASRMSR